MIHGYERLNLHDTHVLTTILSQCMKAFNEVNNAKYSANRKYEINQRITVALMLYPMLTVKRHLWFILAVTNTMYTQCHLRCK